MIFSIRSSKCDAIYTWSFEAFKLAEPEKDIVLPSATPQPIVPVAPSAVPSVVPVQSQVKISTPMLKKLNRTKKTLQIRWSKGKDISGYKVYLSTKKQKGYKVIASIKTSKLNYRLKKLAKNKKYYVKVRAYKNVDGKKVYSDYSKIKTFRR